MSKVSKLKYFEVAIFIFLFLWVSFWIFFAFSSGNDGEIGSGIINAAPEIAFLGIILLSLKFRKIGSVLLILSAVFTVFFFNSYNDRFLFLMVSLPPFIAGVLLLISAFGKARE